MNKGGVGKTSLIINLASALATKYSDKKVLIVDTDGQGNASMSFDSLPSEYGANVSDVFVGESTFSDVKVKISENMDIVPANDDMNYL
jgi:chromosome partitioning protein